MFPQLLKALKENKLFDKIKESELNFHISLENLLDRKAGEIIFKEGDPGGSVYIVISGEVAIDKTHLLGKAKKEIVTLNDFFGEEDYLEDMPRTCTAYAISDSTVVRLDGDILRQLCTTNEQFFYNIRRQKNEFPDETFSAINLPQVDFNSNEIEPEEPVENNDLNVQENSVVTENLNIEENLDITEDLNITENFDTTEVSAKTNSENKANSVNETKADNETNLEDNLNILLNNEALSDSSPESLDLLKEEALLKESFSFDEKSDEELEEYVSSEKYVSKETEMPSVFSDANSSRESSTSVPDEVSIDQLKMIMQAAQLVNSNIKIDDLLQAIVDAARNLTGAERGTLYLIDKSKNELWSKVIDGNEISEIRLKMGQGIAGWSAEKREIVNIKDVKNDSRFNKTIDKSSSFVTKNMLCFPISNKTDEIVGVLQLLNSERGEFTRLDEHILSMLSVHAALALDNAELVEKLLQTERVTSLGKTANFLLQDIKKPILVSKRYAEHLKTKTLSPDVAQVVDMLLEQITHVADLVQTASSYSEGKTILHSVVCKLNETMDAVLDKISTNVKLKDCQIIKQYDKDISVKLDRKEFYQCCTHIVRNACDAMGEGGKLLITTKNRK
ncbi:MAG: GAF domain-containing protein, partial [Bacteroidota bacterium]|nr:GAF domain-containing protein [Bacteroidota bacterium]